MRHSWAVDLGLASFCFCLQSPARVADCRECTPQPWVLAVWWEHMSTVHSAASHLSGQHVVAVVWPPASLQWKQTLLMMNDKWQMPSLQTVCVYDWVVCCFKKYRTMIVNLNWRKSELHKTWTSTVKVVNCCMLLDYFEASEDPRAVHDLWNQKSYLADC